MRITSLRLSILALVIVAALAIAPAASATTITDNLFVGSTQVGTLTITQGGTCNGNAISSTSVCVDIEMLSGTKVRVGGPVIGFFGNVNVGGTTTISDDSSGALFVFAKGSCGGAGMKPDVCLKANGPGTTSSLFVVLSNADTSTGITIGGVHVIGVVCGGTTDNPGTCFATTTPTVPEPGTLGLLGTGLVGIAGLVRRRFLS